MSRKPHNRPAQTEQSRSALNRAIPHYEAALQAAFPSGSPAHVSLQWDEARRQAKPDTAQTEQQPVATILKPDPEADIRDEGPHMARADWLRLQALPPGTKLYAAPVAQPAITSPEQLAAGNSGLTRAAADVLAERRRQIEAKGWTFAYDDLYSAAELPRAAAAYVLNGANDEAPYIWPFAAKWWKPRDSRANYVRAAALLLAEIERIDRAVPPAQGGAQ